MRPLSSFLVLLVLLLGCGGPVSELVQPPVSELVQPSQLEVSASDPVILPGTQTRLQARAVYDDGNWLDVTDQVVWSSIGLPASGRGRLPGNPPARWS